MIPRAALQICCSKLLNRGNTFSGLINQHHVACKSLARGFLSQAYYCNEEWQKRFNSPILTKFKLDNYYYEIDRILTSKKPVQAVDIDIFANMVTKKDDLDLLEDLVHRFRRTPQTIHTLDSTSHAVIRTFLHCENSEGLMRILNDRINYGIFPDHFTYNIMMDTYLEQKNYRDAAKVATFLMLQEDFTHPLTNILALYSCHKYLENPSDLPWDPEEETAKEEDDGEDVWVRVRFIYPPYYDDHFDLRDPKHLVGKTLHLVGKNIGGSIGESYHLVGLALWQKWDLLKKCLEDHISSNEKTPLVKNCVDKVLQIVSDIKEEETKKKIESEIGDLVKKLELVDEDLDKVLLEKLNSEICVNEEKDIKNITADYDRWIEQREIEVKKNFEEYAKQERLQKIEEKLADIKKREELLFFFDNIEKHRLNIPPEEEDKMINEEGQVSGKSLLDVPPEIEGKIGRFSSGIIDEHEPWWRWKKEKMIREKLTRGKK